MGAGDRGGDAYGERIAQAAREEGGVHWSVTWDGQPLDATKRTYNQAFAIYALSAYKDLTGEVEALALAKALYALIESRCALVEKIWHILTKRFRYKEGAVKCLLICLRQRVRIISGAASG